MGVRLEVEIEGGKGGGEWFGGQRLWALGGSLGWSSNGKEPEPEEQEQEEEQGGDKAGNGVAGEGEDGRPSSKLKDEKAWEKCFWASFDAIKPGGE